MHVHETVRLLMMEFRLDSVSEGIWVLTLGFALYAAWVDWRTRRIPNWLTISGFFAGVLLNSILGGWQGAKGSLEGAGLALGLLLPVVLLRGLGAGDWKLMGAMGALMAWRPMLFVLLVAFFCAGLMAVVKMSLTGHVKRTLSNLLVLAKGLATFGLRMDQSISLDNPALLKVPFGAAVGAATVLSFFLVHWPR